ncbi:MAG: class I SAM-dependent methyltransferase [Candidatus Cloacimonetes bacterium]|nr:class I SAM-dependent methyltransferase [Candidatus Cloacimonadota bacterium]MCF7868673.1 class I SAM-dependent methyltransferase [Candidatus Cloacimonadota bacterium]
MNFNEKYSRTHHKRFEKSLNFLLKHEPPPKRILDLGSINPLSHLMQQEGYDVLNTPAGIDLDLNCEILQNYDYDLFTAFEIFEHLVNPFSILKAIKSEKMILSVPLKLWFAKSYWSDTNPYDRHYHEFEPRQLEMLLRKADWKILQQEKWVSVSNKIGIRPLLRRLTFRHMIVYCEKMRNGSTK